MLATSKNVLLPGHNHLLTTGADDPTLDYHPSASEWRVMTQNMTLLEVASMVVTGGYWLFCPVLAHSHTSKNHAKSSGNIIIQDSVSTVHRLFTTRGLLTKLERTCNGYVNTESFGGGEIESCYWSLVRLIHIQEQFSDYWETEIKQKLLPKRRPNNTWKSKLWKTNQEFAILTMKT